MSVEPWQAAQALGSALKSNKSLLELNVTTMVSAQQGGRPSRVCALSSAVLPARFLLLHG